MQRVTVIQPEEADALSFGSEVELAVDFWEVDRRLGAADWEEVWEPWPEGMPPEPSRGWSFRAACGLLMQFRQSFLQPDRVMLSVAAGELPHALMHLPFTAKVTWQTPTRGPSGPRVLRADEAGNHFEVMVLPTIASARCVVAQFEARGHHQHYFVDEREVEFSPPPLHTRPRFHVVRQDDGGHRALVCACFQRAYAEHLVRLLEAQPRHKQLYEVVEVRSDSVARREGSDATRSASSRSELV
jgi:hypothetical protein